MFIGILKCFASWIIIEAFDENLLLNTPLLNTILDVLVSSLSMNSYLKLLYFRNQHIIPMNFIKVRPIVYVIYLNYVRYGEKITIFDKEIFLLV